MKKLLFLFLLVIAHFTYAQKVTLTGVVRNPEGTPVRQAVITDGSRNKAKTDSTGMFSLAVNMPASLHISAVGYRDTAIIVDHQMDVAVVLKYSVNITAARDKKVPVDDPGNMAAMSNMKTQMRQQNTEINPAFNGPQKVTINMGGRGNVTLLVQRNVDFDAGPGAIFPQFNPKEETQGSRYLFKDWVPGWVINTQNEMIDNRHYVYNYDKMGGGLLATKDGRSAIEVNRDIIKYFSLVGENGDTVTFANVPVLDRTHYVQVLSEGNKFGIYKVVKTKFEKANYTTDGVMSQGNNFDSYTDEYTYYMIDARSGRAQPIVLKKKAIKSLFTTDATKVNKFMDDHASDNIDDGYLRDLGNYMNE